MSWHMVFQLIPVAAWFAALLCGVCPLGLGFARSALLGGFLAVGLAKFAFFACMGGDFSPHLPQGVIWAYSAVYAAIMFYVLFSFVALLFDGVRWLFSRRWTSRRLRRLRASVFAVLAAAIAFWGMYEALRVPRVRTRTLCWRDLPASFDGYRIIHLSDLHASSAARKGRFEGIVSRVNALKADLVVITGDFVDGWVDERSDDLSPLARLEARDGVLGCTGNHEAYWDWPGWSWTLSRFKIVFPETEGVQIISRAGETLAIGALPDAALTGYERSKRFYPQARQAFLHAPPQAFRILLNHRPVPARIGAEEAGVRLVLSGHTHGGAMPLIHYLVASFNDGHTRGVYAFAPASYLFVSPGTGQWSGFPLRLFNPTEITEIILKKEVIK